MESAHGFDLDLRVRLFQGTGNMPIKKKKEMRVTKQERSDLLCHVLILQQSDTDYLFYSVIRFGLKYTKCPWQSVSSGLDQAFFCFSQICFVALVE